MSNSQSLIICCLLFAAVWGAKQEKSPLNEDNDRQLEFIDKCLSHAVAKRPIAPTGTNQFLRSGRWHTLSKIERNSLQNKLSDLFEEKDNLEVTDKSAECVYKELMKLIKEKLDEIKGYLDSDTKFERLLVDFNHVLIGEGQYLDYRAYFEAKCDNKQIKKKINAISEGNDKEKQKHLLILPEYIKDYYKRFHPSAPKRAKFFKRLGF